MIGAGNWGTTLAVLWAQAERRVLLYTHRVERAAAMARDRENVASLAGIRFPDSLEVTDTLERAAAAPTIVLTIASDHMHGTCVALAPHLTASHQLVSAAKGLELGTGRRMSEVIGAALPAHGPALCVLSGPNLASEIATGQPAASVLACRDRQIAHDLASLLGTRLFRLYTTDDVTGVEMGGSLKNVVALAAGICDGLGIGANGKAAIITRGMAEIVRLGRACGAHPLTFSGLSGFGDLFATCVSTSSRNHYVGEQLGLGRTLPEIRAGMTMVAEGVGTAPAARALASRLAVEMPITDEVCRVLFEQKDPRDAMADLLGRIARDERTGEIV